MNKIAAAFVGALTIFTVVLAPLAGAVEYGDVGGRPANPRADNSRTKSIFIYTLKGGQTDKDGIKVFNNTDSDKNIALYAVDSVLSSGGAFACAQQVEPRKDVGSWITLKSNKVQIKAHQNTTVPFTVAVPKNAEVGEHDGCITIQDVSAKPQATKNSGVTLSFRSALRVVVTIPGKIVKKLTITAIDTSKDKSGAYQVTPHVKNEGNVSLDTDMTVRVKSLFGSTLDTTKATYPILPRTEATWNFKVSQPFWGGWYRAHATATYHSNPIAELGVNSSASRSATLSSAVFFVEPTLAGGLIELAILILIVALAALYIKKQRNIRHVRQNWEDYKVKKDDDINSVAKQHHTSWKKLARINHIKPPYHLAKDQVLKVPPQRKV